jgi:hypothetical protein
MASLTGTKIKDTYDSLLKVSDNGALDGTLQTITDGLGNNSALSLSTAGASVGGTLAVSGNAAFDTNTLFVDAANNGVGIGTTPSGAKLDVLGNLRVRRAAASTQYTEIESGGGESFIRAINGAAASYQALIFQSGNNTTTTERMRIDSSGNVGIGTNSPSKLSFLETQLSVESTQDAGIHIVGNRAGADAAVGYLTFINNGSTVTSFNKRIAGLTAARDGDDEAGNLQFLTSNSAGTLSERMRIDSSGNVAVKANALLAAGLGFAGDTSSAGAGKIELYDTTTGALIIDGFGAGYLPNGGVQFRVAGTERMRITSGGDVLIGAQVTPSGSVGGSGFIETTADRNMLYLATTVTTTAALAVFLNPNGTVGSIATNGSSTAFNTSSDYRLKEDWVAMEGALDRVDALKPINFAWKADGSRVDGFLAHELAEVVPEAVTGEKDATEIRSVEVSPAVYEDVIHPAEEAILDEEGNVIEEAKEEWVEKVLVSEAVFEDQEFPVYQGIDQSKIVPLLVAAIQELRAELDALKQA